MNYSLLIMGGHMTRDVETAFTPKQTQIAKGGIAVNDRDRVCFLDWVAFGKTAEFLAKHFSKGNPVILQGRLQLDTWEKDGQKRSKHEMVVDKAAFAGPKEDPKADPKPRTDWEPAFDGDAPSGEDVPF